MNDVLSGLIDRPEIRRQLAGADRPPLTDRTINRYENQPDGLPYIVIGGRKYYRVEAVREFIAKRERRPNPRRAI